MKKKVEIIIIPFLLQANISESSFRPHCISPALHHILEKEWSLAIHANWQNSIPVVGVGNQHPPILLFQIETLISQFYSCNQINITQRHQNALFFISTVSNILVIN